jgi:hypothetical protein
MKAKYLAINIFLAVVFLVLAYKPALGAFASEGAGGVNFFDTLVDKTAHGQKIEGTINVVYVIDELNPPCESGPMANMAFTMRMEKDDVLYPFSDIAQVCLFDFDVQVAIIKDFISANVIPVIFPRYENPTWKIKAIRNIAQADPNYVNNLEFLMVDVKIAVQKK